MGESGVLLRLFASSLGFFFSIFFSRFSLLFARKWITPRAFLINFFKAFSPPFYINDRGMFVIVTNPTVRAYKKKQKKKKKKKKNPPPKKKKKKKNKKKKKKKSNATKKGRDKKKKRNNENRNNKKKQHKK